MRGLSALILILVCGWQTGAVRADPNEDVCAYSDDFAAREVACDRIIAADRSDGRDVIWAYANRCKARHNQEDLAGALSDCSFVLERDPQHWQSYHNRSIVYFKMRRYQESLNDINESLLLNSSNFGAYVDKGNALCALARSEDAFESYRIALNGRALDTRTWQRFLKDRGYYTGQIDGKFGPMSRAAMQKWARAECI